MQLILQAVVQKLISGVKLLQADFFFSFFCLKYTVFIYLFKDIIWEIMYIQI